jgi:hypothetical protein
MRKPIAKKKPTNVMMPPEYPTEPGSKPRMLQKGKPINNPQATKLGTNLEAATFGAVLGGLQGHRGAAGEAKRAALRKKDPGKGLAADARDVVKTTTDFYKMKSPPPVPGPKMKKPRGR